MSSIIYVVPWAICDTDNMYIKKVNSETVDELKKGTQVDDWCVRNVIPNPDRRSKDIYAIVDVFNGYESRAKEKGTSVFELRNSTDRLAEYGYKRAESDELTYIRQKVLKLDRAVKKSK